MQAVQPTLTITIDDQSFEVASTSEQVRQMVAYMDDWRQKEVDQSSELLMTRNALVNVQNTLLTTIRQEQEAATLAAADAVFPTTPVDAVPADAGAQ